MSCKLRLLCLIAATLLVIISLAKCDLTVGLPQQAQNQNGQNRHISVRDVALVNTEIQAASDALVSVVGALELSDSESLSQLIIPFRKVITVFTNAFNLISVFFPSSPDTTYVDFEIVQQNLVELNIRMYKLAEQFGSFSYDEAWGDFKKAWVDFKDKMNYLQIFYNFYTEAIAHNRFPGNATYQLSQLRETCSSNSPLSHLQTINAYMIDGTFPGISIKGCKWFLKSVKGAQRDLLNTLIYYLTMQAACLGVSDGAGNEHYNEQQNNKSADLIQNIASVFAQTVETLKNEFFSGNRLNGEVEELMRHLDTTYNVTADKIYEQLNMQYYFNSWLVHVFEYRQSQDDLQTRINGDNSRSFGWGNYSYTGKRNLVYIWSSNGFKKPDDKLTCVDRSLQNTECTSGGAECAKDVSINVVLSCGQGYDNVIHYAGNDNGYFVYDQNKFAVEKKGSSYVAVTTCPPSETQSEPYVDTHKSGLPTGACCASASAAKNMPLWLSSPLLLCLSLRLLICQSF